MVIDRVTLIAEVTEPSPDVVDEAMSRLGGEVIRRPLADQPRRLLA